MSGYADPGSDPAHEWAQTKGNNMQRTTTIPARNLSGTHIGSEVEFHAPIRPGASLEILVSAELRQVHHSSSETILNVASVDDHSGDLEEFILRPGAAVTVHASEEPDAAFPTREDLKVGSAYRIVRQPYWWDVQGNRTEYDWSELASDIVTVQVLRASAHGLSGHHDPDVLVDFYGGDDGKYLDPACLDPTPVTA